MPIHEQSHASAIHRPNFLSERHSASVAPRRGTQVGLTTVALVVRRPLDLAAIMSLFTQLPEIKLVAAAADLSRFAEDCKRCQPTAALIDVSYPNSYSFTTAESLLGEGVVEKVVFLDNQFAVCRAQKALALDCSCYATRDNTPEEISRWLSDPRAWITNLSTSTINTKSLSKSRRIRVYKRLRINSLNDYDTTGVSSLSRRERTVMSCVARGLSNAEIAQLLDLSPSTIDNHKSRLMKKLEIKRSSQLVRLAIDAGLID